MKNQSFILMLPFMALSLALSIKAMEIEGEGNPSTTPYYKTEEFKNLDPQTQLWLLEEANKVEDDPLTPLSYKTEGFKNLDLSAQLQLLKEADERDETHLNNLLTTEISLPFPPENDPELEKALILSLSIMPGQNNKGQPEVEGDPDLEKALAASLISVQEDEPLLESGRRTERKQEKKLLVKNIVEHHPQVIALREDKKEVEAQLSDAWNRYYEHMGLPDSEEKKQSWTDLLNKDQKLSSELVKATSDLNFMIEQYLGQDFLGSEDKNPESKRWQEKKKLKQELRHVRFETTRLREELRKKENEATEANKQWLASLSNEDRQAKGWEKFDTLKKDANKIQLELGDAIARESEKIADYFMFMHKRLFPQ